MRQHAFRIYADSSANVILMAYLHLDFATEIVYAKLYRKAQSLPQDLIDKVVRFLSDPQEALSAFKDDEPGLHMTPTHLGFREILSTETFAAHCLMPSDTISSCLIQAIVTNRPSLTHVCFPVTKSVLSAFLGKDAPQEIERVEQTIEVPFVALVTRDRKALRQWLAPYENDI